MLIIFVEELFQSFNLRDFSGLALKSPSLIPGSTTIFPESIKRNLVNFMRTLPHEHVQPLMTVLMHIKHCLASKVPVCMLTNKTSDPRHVTMFLDLFQIVGADLTVVAAPNSSSENLLERAISTRPGTKIQNVILFDPLKANQPVAERLGIELCVTTVADLNKPVATQINMRSIRQFLADRGIPLSDFSNSLELQIAFQQALLLSTRDAIRQMTAVVDPMHPLPEAMKVLLSVRLYWLQQRVTNIEVKIAQSKEAQRVEGERLCHRLELEEKLRERQKANGGISNEQLKKLAQLPAVPTTSLVVINSESSSSNKPVPTSPARIAVMLEAGSSSELSSSRVPAQSTPRLLIQAFTHNRDSGLIGFHPSVAPVVALPVPVHNSGEGDLANSNVKNDTDQAVVEVNHSSVHSGEEDDESESTASDLTDSDEEIVVTEDFEDNGEAFSSSLELK